MAKPTIPARRTQGQTLKDRLSQNAYEKILPARYLRKDEDGNVVETQEELFDRIASNIALAEIPHFEREHKMYVQLGGVPIAVNESTIKDFKYEDIEPLLTDEEKEHYQKIRGDFRDMMEHLDFVPNTPTLMNAGDELQQLSACFVMSPEDDIDDIHDKARKAALVFQSGGGCGYSFSRLRPYGDQVGSTGGIASGPITFMRTYDQMCETIAQGGARRGAQMGILRVDHPDIVEFIHAKNKDVSLAHCLRLNDPDDPEHVRFSDALAEARGLLDEKGRVPKHLRNAVEGHLSNFNISVAVTDAFMEALGNGESYNLINPRTGQVHIATNHTKEMWERYGLGNEVVVGDPLCVDAQLIWDRIISGAHQNGEPGVIYIDRINEMHSFDVEKYPEHEILATNPCGEQPLEEYEACNLGHINLSTLKEVNVGVWDGEEDFSTWFQFAIDWEEYNRRIDLGVRFLDNVVTMSRFPVKEIEEKVRNTRKIGLGVMGMAQLFVQLGIPYNSPEAEIAARCLMYNLNYESKEASHRLAKERGSFPDWKESKYATPVQYDEWFRQHVGHEPDEWREGFPIRNHNTTTIAPTGTTGMIANTTGGCEPIFNVAHFKNVSDDVQGDEMLVEFDDYFLNVLEANGVDVEAVKEEAVTQMNTNSFTGVDGLTEVPENIRGLFVVTNEISAIEHAAIQCACQQGVDSAISKTINAPSDASIEEAKEVFQYVYDHGGKGVTYYRDGSRSKQVLTTRKDNTEYMDEKLDAEVEELEAELASETDIEEPPKPTQNYSSEERPAVMPSETHRVRTGYGNLYVTVTFDEHDQPFEVFATIGNSGGFTSSFVEGIGKICSVALRSGVDAETLADKLCGIRSPEVGWDNGEQIQSVPDGIGKAILRSIRPEIPKTIEKKSTTRNGVKDIIDDGHSPECPECGDTIIYSQGCKECTCGWSQC